MSDPRFARLKSDPRFRRPKTKTNKVVIDERFKSVFNQDSKKAAGRKVDKYGRRVSKTEAQDNLRRYYRLEADDEDEHEKADAEADANADADADEEPPAPRIPDLARGEVLLESSDEEDNNAGNASDSSNDSAASDGFITLGRDHTRPISIPDIDLSEGASDDDIDLDESTSAALAAQAAAYRHSGDEDADEEGKEDMERTARIAVVNLDWDHVRAHHLYKICASLVSPTAPIIRASASTSSSIAAAAAAADKSRYYKGRGRTAANGAEGSGGGAVTVARGRVLSVKVYPSDFGKGRMEREAVEGPPKEIFRKKEVGVEEVNERTVYEVGGEDEYDEDALRKYQLERLRYYYAVVTCDTVDAASHIYNELEGTELERSANVFDMSFVPDGMTFENEPRDEATDESNSQYNPVDFVTDALRHSKVKLTWDDDDPERNHVTRRALTKKEIEENDFRAYIANTSSESESDDDNDNSKSTSKKKKKEKKKDRDALRALLLGGNDDAMPEGWGEDGSGARAGAFGAGDGGGDDDVDMEITFTPGLSATKVGEETTLEKYQRKMREKRKRRKEKGATEGDEEGAEEKEKREKRAGKEKAKEARVDDEFFEAGSDGEVVHAEAEDEEERPKKGDKKKGKKARFEDDKEKKRSAAPARKEATEEELALLAASSNPDAEPKHFNLKSVIKAEKSKKRRKGRKDKKEDDGEAQEDFVMNVKDERFKVLFEDHQFAIDPTNPHFKKTKAMGALLEERHKRQRELRDERPEGETVKSKTTTDRSAKSLQSLVESVKRKSANVDPPGQGKRRRL